MRQQPSASRPVEPSLQACAALCCVMTWACTGAIAPDDTDVPPPARPVEGSVGPRPAPPGVPPAPAGPPTPGRDEPPSPPGMPSPSPPGGPPPTACAPPAAPLRRLNHFEYDSTVTSLFGDLGIKPSAGFPADDRVLGYDTVATGLVVSPLLAEGYLTAAEAIAEKATANLSRILECDPARTGESACARQFVQTFGRRVWRRPLTDDEASALLRTFDRGRSASDFRGGVRVVLERMLQSPHFLYRTELGGTPDGVGRVRLTPWQIAARLSYGLWGTMPDEPLFAAAQSGALASEAEIGRQARRMLKDARAREVLTRFADQWLLLDEIDHAVKDDKAFPGYGSSTRSALKGSIRRFFVDVVFDGAGDVAGLLTASHAFVNDRIAPLFGLADVTSKDLVRVDLDPQQRRGLLTHAGIMAMTAKAAATNPVRRGVYVREQILGTLLPPPAPDVDTNLPTVRSDATTRERFAAHTKDPSCAACHALIDPLGFGFETYDPIGRWRTTEKNRPVDASGELVGSDVPGKFVGAAALADRLAGSDQVRAHVVRELFRFTFGRAETPADDCALALAKAASARSGHRLLDFIAALTETDTFRTRQGGTP